MSVLVELPEEEYSATAFADFGPATGFGIGTARAMAWMSQLAYETRWPDKIGRVGRMWGLDSIRPLDVPVKSVLPLSDTRGILATGRGAVIIAFAGTDPLSLRNWISNLYLGRLSADVHEGFQAAAAVAWADVGTVIVQPVIYCGPQSRRGDRRRHGGSRMRREESAASGNSPVRRAARRQMRSS